MKRKLSFMLASLLVIGSTYIPVQAKEINNYDIIVGSVEDNNLTSKNLSTNDQEDQYTLDFSCLDVKVKNKKIVATLDNSKIENVAKTKNFTEEKKDKLIENASKTKSLLDNDLNDESIQSEISQIIEQHRKKTSNNPVISLKEENSNDSVMPTSSGQTETNSAARIYTSVSGSGTTAWGQTNVYLKSPTTMGAALYYKDAVSLSWDSPWKITNDYKITFIDAFGGDLWTTKGVRCNGGNNSLAYSYPQGNVYGVYVGATLANGSKGGNDFYSTFIHTGAALAYSYSAKNGSVGLSVSPTTATSSVQSHVYFTR